jgi:Rps23 Pro-64 3,4-dihydroxylase Tpa1-like proline 4-hydroxylase
MYFLKIFDNYLEDQSMCETIENEFPLDVQDYYVYNNVFEKKKAVKSIKPTAKKVIDALYEQEFIEKIEVLSGISGLEPDPFLHGAGMHVYEDGSFLMKHLDYSIHPKSGKERRLNAILYLSDWDDSYGGALQFYKHRYDKEPLKIYPKRNRLVIFETNDFSIHGVEKISCPSNVYRKTVTCFYLSEPRPNIIVRNKALFLPDDESLSNLAKLRSESLL